MQLLDRNRCTRHLHEGQYPFLHACTAGSGENNIRASAGNGFLDTLNKSCTHSHAHRSTHIGKILNTNDNGGRFYGAIGIDKGIMRSEEHTSELQSLMRNSYAVFCLTKKK